MHQDHQVNKVLLINHNVEQLNNYGSYLFLPYLERYTLDDYNNHHIYLCKDTHIPNYSHQLDIRHLILLLEIL